MSFYLSDIYTCFINVRNRLCFRTELLRRIKRYQVANHSCMVIKYEKDNRYDTDGVATHDRWEDKWKIRTNEWTFIKHDKI